MTEIIIIVAISKNNVIGRDNQIPWHIPVDFKHFKDITMGYPCVMGRKTYESLPENVRPLPGRENIVVTRQENYSAPGATVVKSVDEAIAHATNTGREKAFVIGGSAIYNAAMDHVDTLEITRIDKNYEGDTLYPLIDTSIWEEVSREDLAAKDVMNSVDVSISFIRYTRKK